MNLTLFVYGTLRRGGVAGAMLDDCRFLRATTVPGTLYDLGGYPALTLSGTDDVQGELWRCPPETIRALDSYEGVAEGLFQRTTVPASAEEVQTYVAGPRLIPELAPERILSPACWNGPGPLRPDRP